MILFRAYVAANDQSTAEAVARGYLLVLKRVAPFKVKIVQPYWKIHGQYEVVLESSVPIPGRDRVISDLVSLLGVSPQQLSDTEAIWSEMSEGFPLTGAKWAHAELS